jgi:hypothetical protein
MGEIVSADRLLIKRLEKVVDAWGATTEHRSCDAFLLKRTFDSIDPGDIPPRLRRRALLILDDLRELANQMADQIEIDNGRR